MLNTIVIVIDVISALFLILTILLHSGRGSGLSDMFGGTSSLSGGTAMERTLDRLTVITALVFARPALAVMAGRDWPEPQAFIVPAAFEKGKKPGRREYLRARLGPDGAAEVFHSEGSGLVGGLSWADGLVELPDGAAEIRAGAPVRYLPWASFGLRV